MPRAEAAAVVEARVAVFSSLLRTKLSFTQVLRFLQMVATAEVAASKVAVVVRVAVSSSLGQARTSRGLQVPRAVLVETGVTFSKATMGSREPSQLDQSPNVFGSRPVQSAFVVKPLGEP